MNKIIRIVYIDDKIDNYLSRYLGELYFEDIEVYAREVTFDSGSENYITLLEKENVKLADIVIVDSKLFENQSVDQKFSGEEFKMIYTTANPYSKVIVISQNDGLEKFGTIKKFNPTLGKGNPKEFYDHNLRVLIEDNIKEIIYKRNILTILKNNSEAYKGSLIVEKINELMEGTSSYKDLTDEKIDFLIELIEKNIKPMLDGDK